MKKTIITLAAISLALFTLSGCGNRKSAAQIAAEKAAEEMRAAEIHALNQMIKLYNDALMPGMVKLEAPDSVILMNSSEESFRETYELISSMVK